MIAGRRLHRAVCKRLARQNEERLHQVRDIPKVMVKHGGCMEELKLESPPAVVKKPHGVWLQPKNVRLDIGCTRYEVSLKFDRVQEDGYPGPICKDPQQVVTACTGFFDDNPQAELFGVIMLDRKNRVICRQMVTQGTATSTLVHPREVFRAAIMAGACAIVCVHNHPSGDPAPSAADIMVTRQLREAARAVDIELHDHVIVGDKMLDPAQRGFFSFRAAGML